MLVFPARYSFFLGRGKQKTNHENFPRSVTRVSVKSKGTLSSSYQFLLKDWAAFASVGIHIVKEMGLVDVFVPLPFKSLMLVPTDGTPGHGAGGYSDGQGNYKLRSVVPGAIKDFPGCPPGKYQVIITEPQIPLSDADFADPASQVFTETEEPAPAIMLLGKWPQKAAGEGSDSSYVHVK